jgi:3-dehydroquinate dehydratase-2
MTSRRIVVANGPNLNELGTREPDVYGSQTLGDIQALVDAKAQELGWQVDFFQTNHEGEMIDRLQKTARDSRGVVINPGAWGHYSHALGDCLRGLSVPIVEVHLTNLYARALREPYRSHNVTAAAARGYICGLGARGYLLAMEYLSDLD